MNSLSLCPELSWLLHSSPFWKAHSQWAPRGAVGHRDHRVKLADIVFWVFHCFWQWAPVPGEPRPLPPSCVPEPPLHCKKQFSETICLLGQSYRTTVQTSVAWSPGHVHSQFAVLSREARAADSEEVFSSKQMSAAALCYKSLLKTRV